MEDIREEMRREFEEERRGERIREEEEKRKEEEMKRRNEEVKIIRGIVASYENIFRRQRNVDDICLRNCLFVDKLSMILDIGLGFMTSQMHEDYPIDLKDKINKIHQDLSKDLDNLMSWVRTPTYDPSHPFGQSIIKDLPEKAEINDSLY
jgi:hypothetical protein